MVVGNQLQADQSKLLFVLVPVQKFQSVYIHWDELFWQLVLPMFLQSTYVTNSSTLGRLGAVTLAASRLVVQIEEAQKLVQLPGV